MSVGPVPSSGVFALSQLGIALCYGHTASHGAAAVLYQCIRAVVAAVFAARLPGTPPGVLAARSGSRWYAPGGKMGKTASKLKSRRSQSQCAPLFYLFRNDTAKMHFRVSQFARGERSEFSLSFFTSRLR